MVMMMNYDQYERRYDQFLDHINSGKLESNWNSVLEYLIDRYELDTKRLKNLSEENEIYVNNETIFDAINEKQFIPEIREPILTTLLELHYDGSNEDQKYSQKIMKFLTNTNVQHIDHPNNRFPEQFNENSEYKKIGEIFNLCDDQVSDLIQYLKNSWDINLATEDNFSNIFKPQLAEYQTIGKNTPANFLNTITNIPDDSVMKLLNELQDMGLFKQILHQKYKNEFYKSPKITLDSLIEEIDIIESKQNGSDHLEYLYKLQEDLNEIQNDLNSKYIFRIPGQRTLAERFDEVTPENQLCPLISLESKL
jgi:hypothetical protein